MASRHATPIGFAGGHPCSCIFRVGPGALRHRIVGSAPGMATPQRPYSIDSRGTLSQARPLPEGLEEGARRVLS